MSGGNNIRVVCRFRPQNEREINSGGQSIVNVSEDRTSCKIKGEASDHTFTFDRVFPPTITQKDIFEECARPTLEDVFKGYNGTIFVYGQTSSGKTHTMMGPEGGKGMEDPTQKGLIPRLVVALFETIFKCSEDIEFLVKVSYVEIYMERIRDLLDISKDNLAIREDKAKNIYIESVTEVYVGGAGEVIDLMKQGTSNRSIAATKMNAESSRSHSLFIITISQKHLKNGGSRAGKLFLVDLAGSEKIAKTGAEGQTLEEAKMINKSLSTLGNVINALTDGKSTHVPYRDSKLTRILQESLGGNARTTLIINCSPSSYNEAETMSTLRFGSRAKNIKNKAKINQELSAAELKQRLAAAELEIERLKAHIAAGGGPLPTDSSGPTPSELHAQVADLEAKLHDIEEQNSLMETNIENLTAKLTEKETEVDQLREELRAAKALEDQLRKTDAENGKALAELNSALDSLKFELKEKLLSLESAAAQQASNVKEAAAAQAALAAMREELQEAEREAEAASELLKVKELAWEEEKQRILAERAAAPTNGTPGAAAATATNSSAVLRGVMTSLAVAQDATAKVQTDAGLPPSAATAGTAADGSTSEEAKLRQEVARLSALLAASGDERAIRLENELLNERQSNAAKLQEFENLKAALVLDLKTRCSKIVDLELLLDEAREQYEDLVKNGAWKTAQQKSHALQQALDASQANNQKLASELHAIRLEREIDEKKLAARTERIQALEGVVQTAQEKLLAQQTTHQAELAKYRALLDTMKGKMNAPSAPHGRIAKPIKGGAKSTADGSGANDEDEQESSGGFWSLFRSPSKKNINVAVSPPPPKTPVLSPRKNDEPPAAAQKPSQ